MPALEGQPESPELAPERREFTRFTSASLAYIDLGESNGGLILNLSEGGVQVQAAEVLVGDLYPRIRFHLPKSEDWIDTGGRIVWRGKTRKEAGIRFIDMPPYTRRKIREWLAFEAQHGQMNMTWQTVQPAHGGEWSDVGPGVDLGAPPPTSPGHTVSSPTWPPAAATIPDRPKFAAAAAPVQAAAVSVPAAVPEFPAATPWRQLPEPSNRAPFKLFETTLGDDQGEGDTEPRRWVLTIALSCVVGVLGFVAGMSVQRPGVPAPAVQAITAGGNRAGAQSAASTTPASVSSTGASVAASVGNPAQTVTANGRGPNGVAPGSAAGGSPAPGTVAAGSGAYGAADTLAGNTGAGGALSPVAPPPALLKLDETAVGASAFVAITTRMWVMVPASFHPAEGTQGNYLHAGDLVYMVEPDYPADAVRDRVEGTVEVVARVGRDGTIERVDSYSGPDILSAAATVAVRQWKYGPTYLYGHAIETVQHVKFVFRLPS
jgi:hypothetical protein